MDGARFDALVRTIEISAPRRAALGALGGGLAALLAKIGSDDAEAKKHKKKKKKKKKCKGQKKCGKKCIPTSGCCSDADCGADQSCVGNVCTCPEGFLPCGTECIEEFLCCSDADCGGAILSCEGGICTCPTASEIPCTASTCCDPATEVCNTSESSCQTGGCPESDICSTPEPFLCGGPGPCFCTTSVEDATVCSDLFGECFACTTDAECTTELEEPAVCINIGPNCTSCDGGVTTACVFASCLGSSTLSGGKSEARRVYGKKLKHLR